MGPLLIDIVFGVLGLGGCLYLGIKARQVCHVRNNNGKKELKAK